ncbi:hypothetical protein [Dehalobacter sp. MCB1]|nr:hypothetical protein [Dehalobacter sp. MCB1]
MHNRLKLIISLGVTTPREAEHDAERGYLRHGGRNSRRAVL